jgi:HAD superfamily hydrolase (TIGR01509 family)
MSTSVTAVTFDAGQTLVELDTELLSARLAERGVSVTAAALDAAAPGAWQRYDQLISLGELHPWQRFMETLLGGALPQMPTVQRAELAEWLFSEQPRRNLWRRPVAGMIELAVELATAGIAVGVISNSEGKLAALFDEIGWSGRFAAIADSGALGMEKPDPEIFAWTCKALGVTAGGVVHIGDSRAADIEGAIDAGMRAIWFGPAARPLDDDRARACRDAAAVRAALRAWGVPV